ncbi:MAG: GNAT family N-acetyltransferase [Acidobacteriota bacterium]
MAVRFKVFSRAGDIERQIWNSLSAHASPMMEWEYFNALESSGSVSRERGYRPCHLMAYEDDRPVALAPLYERDRAWVEFGDGGLIEFMTELTGIPYNQGIVGAIPYTPVPGYQFLHRPEFGAARAGSMLLDHIDHLCDARGLSTSRIYFVASRAHELHSLLAGHGYAHLRSSYSLWFNRDFSTFDDYLGTFKSSRRTKIKRELRTVRDLGLKVDMVPGEEAPAGYADSMYELYVRTWRKHMGPAIRPFLNHAFFKQLRESFSHRISYSVASRSEDIVAMALFYHKNRELFGRYWGCFEEVPFLHFATCYYHPIGHAIQNGFEVMDPGFGGEHKLVRGYEVVPVHHYIKFHGEEQRRVANSILRQVREHPMFDMDEV